MTDAKDNTVRFVAEWVEKDVFRDGELQPDLAQHGHSTHDTFDEADKAAQAGADAHGVVDWWSVEEQHFEFTHGRHEWNTVRRWTEGCEVPV